MRDAHVVERGHAMEQRVQLAAVLREKRRQQIVLHLARHRTTRGRRVPPSGGERHDVAAAILGVAAALGEAALLELVEDAHHVAAIEAERLGDLALRNRLAFVDEQEHGVVMRAKPAVGERVAQPPARLDAEPREEETDVVRQEGWNRPGSVGAIGSFNRHGQP